MQAASVQHAKHHSDQNAGTVASGTGHTKGPVTAIVGGRLRQNGTVAGRMSFPKTGRKSSKSAKMVNVT